MVKSKTTWAIFGAGVSVATIAEIVASIIHSFAPEIPEDKILLAIMSVGVPILSRFIASLRGKT